MLDAMTTILRGIKTWACPKFKAMQAAIDELRRVAQNASAKAEAAQKAVESAQSGAGKDIRLIGHSTLRQSTSAVRITQDGAENTFELTELYVQAYLPGNPDLPASRVVSYSVAATVSMPDGSTSICSLFDLGRAHREGFTFARGAADLATGKSESAAVYEADSAKTEPFSTSTSHFYGPVELDALKSNDAFKFSCIESGGVISGITITAGFGNEFVAGTEFIIRGR